jgi:putative ABC transport system permease protein
MTALTQHLRQAIRSLRRSPAFSLTVIATLGIGIGLNAAIFTVVDCVLLRPLGYRDADRIVSFQTHFVDENRSISNMGGDDFVDLASQGKGLESVAYYQGPWQDGIRLGGQSLYLPVTGASPQFTQVLGVQPLAGRGFQPADQDAAKAIVGAQFAREHFGSAQAALGQTITHEGTVRSIVGVMPDGFSFPGKTEVWLEQKPKPEIANRTAYNQKAVGKRRKEVSAAQLEAELAGFSSRLQQTNVGDQGKTIGSVPLQESIVGSIRPILDLLMGAVAVLLLIVGANVTHLQLVRASRQMRTVTIRTALGASRATLAGRALLEALLLSAAGCGMAILLALPALKLLVRLAPPDIPRLTDIHLNGDVLLFSSAISAALMAATALLPVWRSSHIDPASALRQDASRGTEGRGTARLRNGFLVAEVALTLTLSVAAVMLTRQLIAQSRTDLGFDAENLVTLDSHVVDTMPPPTDAQVAAATPAQLKAYERAQGDSGLTRLHSALDDLATVPGVNEVGAIQGAPMGFDGPDVGYAVKGRQVFAPPFKGLPHADVRVVTPNLFQTMRIPLLRGRGLTADDRIDSPPVLLINRRLAETIFPGQNPVGQQIMCGLAETPVFWTIVGVVGDVRSDSPAAEPTPTLYLPVAQHPERASDMQLVVRTRMAPAAMLQELTRRLTETHPEIAVRATTMRENIGDTQRGEDFRTTLFGCFAAVSLLLAAVGMYGVTSYTVAQRRFEFGLRIALGADRSQLLAMVLRKALTLAAIGILAGVTLSLALTRVLGARLGALPGFDAPSYALASVAVLLIALLATAFPARSAANANPMTVLRSE